MILCLWIKNNDIENENIIIFTKKFLLLILRKNLQLKFILVVIYQQSNHEKIIYFILFVHFQFNQSHDLISEIFSLKQNIVFDKLFGYFNKSSFMIKIMLTIFFS